MKYTEEQITNLLSADLSGKSKIKESLKLKLLNRSAGRKRLSFCAAAFAAAAVVMIIFVLKTENMKQEEYVYKQYPIAPLMEISDRYGAAGPAGLSFYGVQYGG